MVFVVIILVLSLEAAEASSQHSGRHNVPLKAKFYPLVWPHHCSFSLYCIFFFFPSTWLTCALGSVQLKAVCWPLRVTSRCWTFQWESWCPTRYFWSKNPTHIKRNCNWHADAFFCCSSWTYKRRELTSVDVRSTFLFLYILVQCLFLCVCVCVCVCVCKFIHELYHHCSYCFMSFCCCRCQSCGVGERGRSYNRLSSSWRLCVRPKYMLTEVMREGEGLWYTTTPFTPSSVCHQLNGA